MAVLRFGRACISNQESLMTSRRKFCQASLAAVSACALPSWLEAAIAIQPQRILLRSGWQVVNIGDLCHTPGILALLERYLPGTEVRVWVSNDFTVEAAAMIKKTLSQFPGGTRHYWQHGPSQQSACKQPWNGATFSAWFWTVPGRSKRSRRVHQVLWQAFRRVRHHLRRWQSGRRRGSGLMSQGGCYFATHRRWRLLVPSGLPAP